jgi:hypothetical protein
MREQSGGCESADHPNLPARPRESCCLFGSGSSGLGFTVFAVILRGMAWLMLFSSASQAGSGDDQVLSSLN